MNAGCAGKTVRTRAIPERRRGAFTTRCYTNPRLPYLIFTLLVEFSLSTGVPLFNALVRDEP